MIAFATRRRRLLVTPILLALCALFLQGCSAPWAATLPRGTDTVRSPQCHCRFSYPAAWHFAPSNGDPSQPTLGLANYDTSSADHAPVPRAFAMIGIDWLSDPVGQLYLATTTRHVAAGTSAHHLLVSGRPATAYGYWTASPAHAGVYVEHVYLFVPWYQRDYDVSFEAANPPTGNVTALHHVFEQVLRSLTIVPPNVLP